MEQNNQLMKQYMVEFSVPEPLTDELLDLIPDQREAVDELFASGKLLSFSLSLDRTRIWALMLSDSESELLGLIDSLPMTHLMDFDYNELMFHNSIHLIPAMSLN